MQKVKGSSSVIRSRPKPVIRVLPQMLRVHSGYSQRPSPHINAHYENHRLTPNSACLQAFPLN